MEKVYSDLKEINKESSELRTAMIFYANMVLHDIHLLSEVKKDIKAHHERNLILMSLDLGSLNMFGPKTSTIIYTENGRIKWTSKNAHCAFGCSKE